MTTTHTHNFRHVANGVSICITEGTQVCTSVDGLRATLASKRGDYDDSESGGMWQPNPEGGVVNWDDIEAALAATPTPAPERRRRPYRRPWVATVTPAPEPDKEQAP